MNTFTTRIQPAFKKGFFTLDPDPDPAPETTLGWCESCVKTDMMFKGGGDNHLRGPGVIGDGDDDDDGGGGGGSGGGGGGSSEECEAGPARPHVGGVSGVGCELTTT
ncbi:hypothetical protein PLESTB_001265600 [Pleodorina starrii]|uniref:Uncharacterized protein n=1 Tax=Pleodorina starrii TaxID=330485 RepID=A0A9W6F5Z9_9CHLO|nr:hypothetical protein PLESTM_000714700 [Pleodorina starrii]GLC57777.1 hypothetical protein PLESTB_001265600 [Pleodorina starrii]GLC65151.1 hypothetical protein PLESTF_000257700 [Pleodorina starrii]